MGVSIITQREVYERPQRIPKGYQRKNGKEHKRHVMLRQAFQYNLHVVRRTSNPQISIVDPAGAEGHSLLSTSRGVLDLVVHLRLQRQRRGIAHEVVIDCKEG